MTPFIRSQKWEKVTHGVGSRPATRWMGGTVSGEWEEASFGLVVFCCWMKVPFVSPQGSVWHIH